jgi:HAMP domain-containing protein
MTFRTRLLLVIALTVVAAVVLIGAIVSASARRAFQRLEEQRVSAVVKQFRQEFDRRQHEIAQRVQKIADAGNELALAISLNGADTAQPLAAAHNLDFLELVSATGSIISSAQYSARFDYHEDWVTRRDDWNSREPFLKQEELPGDSELGLICVRAARGADLRLYIVGGEALDRGFLSSFVLPAGMRALLYRDPASVIDASGPVLQIAALTPLVDEVRKRRGEISRTVQWSSDPASAETFHAIPLIGPEIEVMGAFLVGSSRAEQVRLERFLGYLQILVAACGILLAVLVSLWTTARITRPVEALAGGARAVAAGDWKTQVEVSSSDEIGALAAAFNQMTRQLLEQRDRLVQAERVAAWRELARRLAHELKNPLFPLQITVENLQRARRPSRAVRRGLPREHRHAARRTRQAARHHRPFQRFRENAPAAARDRGLEQPRAGKPEAF